MSSSEGSQMAKDNVYWGSCLANGLERRNAQITSMNHMLWQIEIHAKSIVEGNHSDTQYKICGHAITKA